MAMIAPAFGFGVTPGPPDGVAAEMREAEALGYDRMGVWDSPALFREPWMTLGAVARETRTLRLGTWVSNPVSRHPVVTASAIATLEDLAPGRTYFGIGSGGTGVWHLGHPAARLADLREYVTTVRQLLAEGRSTYRGAECRLEWGRGVSVPIIMSAHGPRALRLAGEIADGVVCGLGILPEVVSGCLDLIAEGAESAGRTLADLEVWFTCFWFVDAEPGAALDEGAWAATAFALHFAQGRVDGKFVPEEYRDGIVRLGEQYDLVAHGRVTDESEAPIRRACGRTRHRRLHPQPLHVLRDAAGGGVPDPSRDGCRRPQLRWRYRRGPRRAPAAHRRLGRAGAASLRQGER